MRKKLLLLLIIPIIIFGFNSNVNAVYNGGSGAIGKGIGTCNPNWTGYCTWNNARHLTIKVSLYYFSGGSRRQIGHSVIATNNDYLELSKANNGIAVYTDLPRAAGTNNSINSDYLETYFLTENAFELYLGRMGTSLAELTEPSQAACSGCNAQYGYRMILEPIFSFYKSGSIYGATIKELAEANATLTNNDKWSSLSFAMYTEFNDVGITAPSGKTSNKPTIANPNIGYGYNIIDITSMIKKRYYCPDGSKVATMTNCVNELIDKGSDEASALAACEQQYCVVNREGCWGRVITKGNPAVCTNSNSNNIGIFYEEYDDSACYNEANEYGRPEDNDFVNNFCRFYCLEKPATQSFPGNVANALSKGYILIWPTSDSTVALQTRNIFPLTFSGVRTCTMVMNGSKKYDIYSQESPYDIYKKYYDYVANNADKIEFNGTFNTEFGRLDYTRLKVDKIRNNTLDEGMCDNYYNPKIDAATSAINSAEAALSHWKSVTTCYDETEKTISEGYWLYGANNSRKWIEPQTEIIKTPRICRDDEWPKKSILETLRSKKSGLENERDYTCKSYVRNYKGMVQTYIGIAKCNNLPVNANSLYDFQTNASIRVQIEGKDNNIEPLNSEGVNYKCTNCTQSNLIPDREDDLKKWEDVKVKYNLAIIKKLVEDLDPKGARERKITVTANEVYSLPSSEIETEKGNGNYTYSRFYGFVIPWSSKVGKKYELEVFNTKLGHKNIFDSILNDINKKPYICNYEVTETPTDDCLCPEGTKHEGEDLYCMIADSNTTCVEAQVDYCDDTTITIPEDCDAPLYCPNNPTIKLDACVNAGKTYDDCVGLLCYGESYGENYHCKNSNGVEGPMDITSCVHTKQAQGLSLQEAIDECDQLLCPLAGNGLKVIYRTISLENPFPGKTISGKVKGFNTINVGRYPGTNWNSLTLVKHDILYSRKYESSSYGSKIYQNEEPLYTFILNTSTINQIRAYNDNHKYDDFLLDCKKDNSIACVSSFVHNADLSGLVGGACKDKTSQSNFYKCSNDE